MKYIKATQKYQKRISKFYRIAVNAYKNGSRSYPDRLSAMMEAIERIQKLNKQVVTEEDRTEAIQAIWMMFNTLQQRMIVEQSIYMEGMQRDEMSQTCMTSIGETPTENWEREQLFKPATLTDATGIDVSIVDHISPVNFSMMAGDDTQLDWYGDERCYKLDGMKLSKERIFHQRHPNIVYAPPRSSVKRDRPEVHHRHQVGG